MHNARVWTAIGLCALLMTGCGGKKEETSRSSAASPPQITVTKGAVKKVNEEGPSKANSGEFYYSYNKAKKEAPVAEQKHRTTLDAYLHIRSPYERVQIELMIKKLSKDFIVRCSPCHDDYANGVIGPSLLGKSGDFIYGRLMDFKTGKRKNVLMHDLVSRIDDAKLKAIADEIAAFNKQIQKLREERRK
ncbi:c-type cytochrome [Nitratifractor sp.]